MVADKAWHGKKRRKPIYLPLPSKALSWFPEHGEPGGTRICPALLYSSKKHLPEWGGTSETGQASPLPSCLTRLWDDTDRRYRPLYHLQADGYADVRTMQNKENHRQ